MIFFQVEFSKNPNLTILLDAKVEKEASICCHEFFKLYNTKKFKLQEKDLMEEHHLDHEHYSRLSV